MNSSKDRILDAAERIVIRDGVMHLTLDAVAQETQMSKGGLLYHFHSKDDLIRGMIARLSEQYEAEVARLEAEDPVPTGRKLRAMINATFGPQCCSKIHTDRVCAALLAAVVTNPSLLGPVHEQAHLAHQKLLEDGLDPIDALAIHFAADGLWMAKLFGVGVPDPALQEQVVQRLLEMSWKSV